MIDEIDGMARWGDIIHIFGTEKYTIEELKEKFGIIGYNQIEELNEDKYLNEIKNSKENSDSKDNKLPKFYYILQEYETGKILEEKIYNLSEFNDYLDKMDEIQRKSKQIQDYLNNQKKDSSSEGPF